jgi:hypothetical protein
MSQTNEISNIINLIQQLETNTGYNVYIPSLEKEVKFKQLTTQQLKNLLTTIFDSPLYNTQFAQTFNTIIKENCLQPEININSLTIYDRLFILFKTRIECISPDYTFQVSNELKNVSLINVLNDFQNKQINFKEEIFTYENCSIVCGLPTLDTENKLENEFRKNIKEEIASSVELQNIIGDTFISEITKFITSINLNNTSINLLEYNFKERIKVIEKLPVVLINKVIKYIETYRETIKQLTICKLNTNSNDLSEVIEKEIPLDATFFNI